MTAMEVMVQTVGSDMEKLLMTSDPCALAEWIAAGGWRQLGNQGNKWRAVLTVCGQEIRINSDHAKRKAYRDAALALLDAGHEANCLSDEYYTEQVIYIRVSYINNSNEGENWKRAEMLHALEAFLGWVPFGVAEVRNAAPGWRELPVKDILVLREIKNYLKLLEYGVDYLSGEQLAQFSEWQDVVPLLP